MGDVVSLLHFISICLLVLLLLLLYLYRCCLVRFTRSLICKCESERFMFVVVVPGVIHGSFYFFIFFLPFILPVIIIIFVVMSVSRAFPVVNSVFECRSTAH